ncbi:MAG: formylglycine-generating enzyme family protein [Treponema sp.]
MKKSLFFACTAAAVLLFGCKGAEDSTHRAEENARITITVAGDANVTLKNPRTFTADKGSAWSALKAQAEAKVDYKTNYENKGWRLGNKDGAILTGEYELSGDATVFAVSKAQAAAPAKITITVLGDAHARPAAENTFPADKGATWSKIELVAESKITNDAGFTRDTWKFDGASGADISADHAFTADTTVFAVSKAITVPVETVTLTIAGDAHVNLPPPPHTFSFEKGKTWAQVKALAESKITYKENYESGGWRLTDSAGAILTDGYAFTADTTIFAESKPIMITITVAGDSGVELEPAVTFQAQKGAAWSAVKAQAAGKVKAYKPHSELKAWHLDNQYGTILDDTHTFSADATVFAQTRSTQITITVKGDENVNYKKAGDTTFTATRGATWASLKSKAAGKVKYAKDYENKDWKLTDAAGDVLTDAQQFNEDATVFAESQKIMVKITLTGDHVTISEPKWLLVPRGTKWGEIKDKAQEKKTAVDNDFDFIGWQINKRPIVDNFPFGRNTTIYAATKPKFIIVTIKAGEHVKLKSGDLTIKKPNGTTWKDIKSEAQAKIDKFDAGYIFSAWKKDITKDSILADVDKFEQDTIVYATAQTVPVPDGVKVASAAITGKDPSYTLPGTDSSWKGVFPAGRIVNLNAYTIGKHEVTVQLWKDVYDWAKANGYSFDFDEDSEDNPKENDKPMANISWRDCIAWCNAYTEMKFGNTNECVYRLGSESGEAIKDAPSNADTAYCDFTKKGDRLPTEAEWEYAARASDSGDMNAEQYGSVYLTKLDSASGAKKPIGFSGMTLPSGETFETLRDETARVAVFNKWWNGAEFIEQTTPVTAPEKAGTEKVGSKDANKLGIHDMSGNVSEWCWDLYKEAPAGADVYFKGPLQAHVTQHVVRGGYWSLETDNAVYNCTVGKREQKGSAGADPIRGFRLVWSD